MEDDNEYEVESIVRSRLERSRGRKLAWKYLVRWKGYSEEDNTWEPYESFGEGAEELIQRFWDRTQTSGRNWNNVNLFEAGETFYPIGPPRRKGKPKRPSSPKPEKRRRGSGDISTSDVDERSQKRNKKLPQKSPSVVEKRRKIPYRESSSSQENSEDEVVQDYLAAPSDSKPSEHEASIEPRSQSRDLKKSRTGVDPVVDSEPQSTRREQSIAEKDPWVARSKTRGDIQSEENPDEAMAPDSPIFGDSDDDDQNVTAVEESSTKPRSAAPIPSTSRTIPSHRARAANPRVKMVDNASFQPMEGAISVKARLQRAAGSATTISALHPSRRKNTKVELPPSRLVLAEPAPAHSPRFPQKKNTSSLLTFQKGTLKTVKGKYSSTTTQQQTDGVDLRVDINGDQGPSTWAPSADVDMDGDFVPGIDHLPILTPTGQDVDMHGDNAPQIDPPPAQPASTGQELMEIDPPPAQPAPTGQELLEIAGLDTQVAEELADFEEPAADTGSNVQADQPNGESLQDRLEVAKDKLFPSASSPTVANAPNAAWKQSTIFGPLGLGTDVPLQAATEAPTDSGTTPTTTPPFFLVLDSSVSIPVVFKDMSSHGSLDSIVSNYPKGPPGKFYREPFALALLATLRAEGSSARIVPGPDADESQEQHFNRFRSRLEAGELFVSVAGVEVLAFCSSQNAVLGKRLDVPPVLLGLPSTVLVSRVFIENYSAYADAAVRADNVRW